MKWRRRSLVERAAAHFFFELLLALTSGCVREARSETFQYDPWPVPARSI